jgi:hypothetical protein
VVALTVTTLTLRAIATPTADNDTMPLAIEAERRAWPPSRRTHPSHRLSTEP